jgi:hypothetical protein
MACPLFKSLISKGTTFYGFPSATQDMNLAFSNDNYKLNFTKFALLNIPEQKIVIDSGVIRDQTKGKLNFDKNENGPNFYNFQPGNNNDLPNDFGDQMVESLRNYIANYDTVLRESKINSNTDFYNINEQTTPTEMIFWKWCKKLNLIDLEPATHKIDWDKNLSDFDNENGTGTNYFQKYLWKERDVNYYDCNITVGASNVFPGLDKPIITIDKNAKFKVGDSIYLSEITSNMLSAETSYNVTYVEYNTSNINETSTYETILELEYNGNFIDSELPDNSAMIHLNYNRFVEYIGEIQAVSKIQTSKKNYTEVTIQIPHHVGKTPTILFEIEQNTNFYPSLEMPIMSIEQQEEIFGSENTNSPIRLNPENYPGTYFGYFDTEDKTYKCSNGDKLRYSGDYYGINLSNNVGLDSENHFENLTDFNSNNIDGLKIDMNKDHYLKMNLPDYNINNFDEFNSTYFDSSPEDFNFNAILWYYELDDGSGTITNNLYGIEFINNPNDDCDECDINNRKITPYRKLVSNGDQNGDSYIFDLNINFNNDNDTVPLSYDPTTIYNQFGFDLYQNILQSNAKLQDNFISIVSGYTEIHEELFDIRSLVYSQTSIDTIKSQIENLNDLLSLYSTFQFTDSDTTTIETNYDGIYPKLKVNIKDTLYSEITNINISNVLYYNNINNANYNISIPTTNQLLLNIYNNNNVFPNDVNILLNKDLSYKQGIDIYIKPNLSKLSNILNININYDDGLGNISATTLLSNITLPIDLLNYDSTTPSASTYTNSYYINENEYTYAQNWETGITTKFYLMQDLFTINDYIHINNFYVISGSTIIDKSGVYQIIEHTSGNNYGSGSDITINLNNDGYLLKTKPKISYYKGWKINILRISSLSTSSIDDRYKITKTLL